MRAFLKWAIIPTVILVLLVLLLTPTAHSQQNALNYFVDGVEAFQGADYGEAISSFKKAIELDPTNLEFQYYLGVTYSTLKRDEEALGIFHTIVEKDPVNFMKAYFDIAAIYSRQKKYKDAIDSLSLAEKVDPKNARIYLEKGYAYRSLQNYEQAIENLNKAKDLDPKFGQRVYYDIAAVYLEAEQFDRAEDMFKKAIEVDPKTAIAENARQAIPQVTAAKRARRPWYLLATFNWAYDDNVPLEPLEGITQRTGIVRDKSDQFQTFFLRGGYKFVNRKDLEVAAGYSLFNVGYKDFVENNVLAHIPHIYLQYNDEPLFLRVEYNFGYYFTGGRKREVQGKGLYLTFGDGSEEKLRMHTIMPTITMLEPYNLKTDITLIYQDKNYLDDVTPDANFYSGGIIQSYKFPNSEVSPRVGYRFAYEDAEKGESSYRFHEGLVGLFSPLFWGVLGDASITYVRTDYPDFPVEGERRDRTYLFSFSLTRLFYERLLAQLVYNHTNNDSNVTLDEIDPFKFRKNVYFFSITFIL